MQETLSRVTLNQKDKEMLEKIIIKDASQMNSEEISIIRARRAYLTAVERVALKEILEEEVKIEETEEIGEAPEGTGMAPQIEEEIKEKKTLKKSKKK